MGILNVVNTVFSFSWITICYAMFFFLMCILRILTWYFIDHKKIKKHFPILLISLSLTLINLAASMVMTILFRTQPVYIIEWIVYGYAAYAFIKLGISINDIVKAHKNKSGITRALILFIPTLFTIFLLEFTLIRTFSFDYTKLFILEIVFQALIVCYTLSVLIYLVYLKVKREK